MSEHVGVPNPARPDGRAIHYGENFVMTTNRASNLAPVANLLRERVSEHVGVPNPARPDGRAIHSGENFTHQSFSIPFVGVRNPARPGGGAIDYGNFGGCRCRSRSRTPPPPSGHVDRLTGA